MVRSCASVSGRMGEGSNAEELAGECTHSKRMLGDNGWLDGPMVGWVNRWMEGRRSGEVERMIQMLWVDGWMDRGQVDERVNG